jgi:alpha-tubulin suppressor-like RCC1 family protein
MFSPAPADAVSALGACCARSRRILWPVGALVTLALAGCDQSDPPTAAEDGLTPALAAATASLSFVQVSAGLAHSCGVTADNRAFCWGLNIFGELGDGTTTERRAPRAVAGGLRFHQVTAGEHYTCGLTTEDRAYCWGDASWGALGDDKGDAGTPRLKPSPVAGGRRYRQVRASRHATCGVTTADVAFCWGDRVVQVPPFDFGSSEAPVRVQTNGQVFRVVVPGSMHFCGLTTANAVYCWGTNDQGQLGDGTQTSKVLPVPVAGGLSFSQLTAGSVHTCGRTTSDIVYCWGYNATGQLGDGTRTIRTTPTRIASGLKFRGVSAGYGHTCGVTLSFLAYCWGLNDQGQLGDGTFRNTHPLPEPVSGGLQFSSVSGMVLNEHTCGITTNNRAYCWGYNSSGQLGHSTNIRRTSPVPVDGPQ